MDCKFLIKYKAEIVSNDTDCYKVLFNFTRLSKN